MAQNFASQSFMRPCPESGRFTRLVPLFAPYLLGLGNERAAIAGLDRLGRLRHFVELAGDMHAVPTILPAVRSILAELSVTEIILAHSHPGLSSVPSPCDLLTTDRLAALARLAGTMLIDHLIFGDDGVYSIEAGRVVSNAEAFP